MTVGDHASPVRVQPTGLGHFLLLDAGGRLLRSDGTWSGGPATADASAEWSGRRVRRMAAGTATGCADFPEAELGTSGTPAPPTNARGDVVGWADTHLHVTASMRAGGSVISGRAFDRFGIARALGGDAAVHGDDGGLDHTGNLLRDGVPFGTHDTAGWPTFTGWPVHDTNTHQQTYHRWLERAWRSGLRLIVAQTVEDTQICRVEPRRVHPCDETRAIRGQIRRLHELQDYVDAQAGGRGRGWFRLVTSPRQARRVVERGRLAVVIGVESSFPLGCRAKRADRCTPKQVDRRLDALRRLGVRSLFVAHWADNGFAGAALQSGVKGKFINAMQRLELGRWFDVADCPRGVTGETVEALSDLEIDVVSGFFPATRALAGVAKPTYPAGRQCNVRGLTKLGRHLVRRMIDRHMLVEVDHLSQRAREAVLRIAERHDYPVVSGHNSTGGSWTAGQLRRVRRLGGVASQTLEEPGALAADIVARGRSFGVGLGTDTGGFAALPGPPEEPLAYPFRLNGVTFERQTTGERTFDLNTDGVAHYGLMPDLIAAMRRRPQGERAAGLLFRSAEAYLRMWERAVRR